MESLSVSIKPLVMKEFFLFLPIGFTAGFFFIFGSFFGSFANVLIYRMQHENKLDLFKRSYCPHCRYKIPFYLNIPIFSWFFLRASCANCSKRISFRYPLIELMMALAFSLLFLSIGWKWFLLEALIFSFMLISSSVIDWDLMILPNSFTLSGIVLGLLGAFLNVDRSFMDSLWGVLLGGGFLLLVSFLYYLIRKREGLGGGDIKMMAWIGAILGWQSLFFVLVISCFLGSLVGFLIMLQSNKNLLETALPFGPYLALSAFSYILLRESFQNVLSVFVIF